MIRDLHRQSETDEILLRDFEVYDVDRKGTIEVRNIEEVLRQQKMDKLSFQEFEQIIGPRFDTKMITFDKVENII